MRTLDSEKKKADGDNMTRVAASYLIRARENY